MAAGDLGIPFWWFEGLHFLYEIKDVTRVPKTNSLLNSVGDQLSGTVGHLLSYKTHHKTFVWLYIIAWSGMVFVAGDTVG